jgi:hypothetical protein
VPSPLVLACSTGGFPRLALGHRIVLLASGLNGGLKHAAQNCENMIDCERIVSNGLPMSRGPIMAEIGLAEVIRALRSELETAMTEGEGQRLQFQATGLAVEFQVGVTKTAEGSAGVRFWVFELGGSGSYASESIQKVNLSLQPVLQSGEPVKIAKGTEESPLAADSAQPGEVGTRPHR